MTRILFAILFVTVLSAALPTATFAQGPACVPPRWTNDAWTNAALNAQYSACLANQRLQQDWNSASRDLTGYNDFNGQVQRGAQQFGQDMETVRTRVYNSGYFGR